MRAARSWALQSYLAVFQALTPIWRRVLQHRLKRGKETPQSLAQKWVTHPAERAAGIWVWGHAVGVGEAMALAGLRSRPPVSKHTPLPTSVTFGPCPQVKSIRRGATLLARPTAWIIG